MGKFEKLHRRVIVLDTVPYTCTILIMSYTSNATLIHCIMPHPHLHVVVDGVGVVFDGSDGSDVGPLPTETHVQ